MLKNNKLKNYLNTAACLSILATSVSPVFASTEFKPLLGSHISVKSAKQFTVDSESASVTIDVPSISGLSNIELQIKLNNKFQTEGEAIYNQFLKDSEEWKKTGSDIAYSLQLGYEVVTDNQDALVLRTNKVQAMGSSMQEMQYYVIDKNTQTEVTLPSLFKDQSYVKIISDYILSRMQEEMKADPGKSYFINEDIDINFKQINENQKFYINQAGELVICFDKYEVAPGYMENLEFVIPAEVIKQVVANDRLIDLKTTPANNTVTIHDMGLNFTLPDNWVGQTSYLVKDEVILDEQIKTLYVNYKTPSLSQTMVTIQALPQKLWEKMNEEAGPVPVELGKSEDGTMVYVYYPLQSNPFDYETKEGKEFDEAYSSANEFIKSIIILKHHC